MKTSISSEDPSQLGAEKIAFPPKPDGWTDIRTDISNYRVALLLQRVILYVAFWTFVQNLLIEKMYY